MPYYFLVIMLLSVPKDSRAKYLRKFDKSSGSESINIEEEEKTEKVEENEKKEKKEEEKEEIEKVGREECRGKEGGKWGG